MFISDEQMIALRNAIDIAILAPYGISNEQVERLKEVRENLVWEIGE